jgi:hypothetical protein
MYFRFGLYLHPKRIILERQTEAPHPAAENSWTCRILRREQLEAPHLAAGVFLRRSSRRWKRHVRLKYPPLEAARPAVLSGCFWRVGLKGKSKWMFYLSKMEIHCGYFEVWCWKIVNRTNLAHPHKGT